MADLDISDMQFNYSEIGDMIKASKGLYTWDFKLEGNRHKVELTHSRIKGKRVITCDGEEINSCLKYTYNYTYSFPLDGHYYTIIQISPDQYDLRIDNESFMILKNKSKRRKEKEKKYNKDDDDDGTGLEDGIQEPLEGVEAEQLGSRGGHDQQAHALQNLVCAGILGPDDELVEQHRQDRYVEKVVPAELAQAASQRF